ncbi:Nn.00g107620.m01.CDS01 [Neocucurbitaria sp. VM-36]
MNVDITAPSYTAWGPFIPDSYVVPPVTRIDLTIAGCLFGLANIFAMLAAYIAIKQTRIAHRPLRSHYIWMIWLEWAASVVINIECLLFLLRIIRPSFYFYMSILLNWSIQIQLLLQIIINRIRVILDRKERGRHLIIGTATAVSLINVSVFCIWIPARLQISETWILTNAIWDRIEKVLYLIIDVFLNYYFIRVVKANLVDNGLEKYNRLVRFNQRIIFVSISMDVMIIAAMSISNSFVYAIFHPLAYLVKLNIELSMAHLIKVVAQGKADKEDLSFRLTFGTAPSAFRMTNSSIFAEPTPTGFSLLRAGSERTINSVRVQNNEILKTKEFVMRSELQQGSGQTSPHISNAWIEQVEENEANPTSFTPRLSGDSDSVEAARFKFGNMG